MSHWKNIAIDMECSIEVLRRILINIMPKWEEHIKVDESGNLVAKSYYQPNQPVKGCSVVIPQGQHTGVSGADIGFFKERGKWKMSYDYKPYEAADLENRIKQEYAVIRTRAQAQAKGFEIAEDISEGNDYVIKMLVPLDYGEGQLEA